MGSHPQIALTAARAIARAPDNELYDRGADLVEAAMAIRRVAGSPEASRAVVWTGVLVGSSSGCSMATRILKWRSSMPRRPRRRLDPSRAGPSGERIEGHGKEPGARCANQI